jgi:triosephosphate isomerase
MPARRTPLLAGNWKMNLNHFEAIAHLEKLAYILREEDFARAEVVVLPPFVDLRSVQTVIDGEHLQIRYGAQDVSPHESGPYTGDISAGMLAKLGCTYVLVGHSERRAQHGETDADVAAKARAALAAEITPIICVGEGLEVRQAGAHLAHCLAQLEAAVTGLPAAQVARLVIAYEPVWAIGTGEVATPEDAQEVCAALRRALAGLAGGEAARSARILYGGSVNGQNIDGIMAMRDIDGALVGGASLDAGEFVRIVRFGRADAPAAASG